jgi:hypothetical protein
VGCKSGFVSVNEAVPTETQPVVTTRPSGIVYNITGGLDMTLLEVNQVCGCVERREGGRDVRLQRI